MSFESSSVEYFSSVSRAFYNLSHLYTQDPSLVLNNILFNVESGDYDAMRAITYQAEMMKDREMTPEQAKWLAIGAATYASMVRSAQDDQRPQGGMFRSS